MATVESRQLFLLVNVFSLLGKVNAIVSIEKRESGFVTHVQFCLAIVRDERSTW